LILATGVLSVLGSLMAQGAPTVTDPQNRLPKDKPAATGTASRGERVFQQNCSRCHNAPQGFPPQISGTILRHMRVRGSLSAADEKALLQFLNP
jgi:mono/diheme cytochrome c family protein